MDDLRLNQSPDPGQSSGVRPDPETLKTLRQMLGLTQEQAADSLYTSARSWMGWERDDDRLMPDAEWELFCIKASRALGREIGVKWTPSKEDLAMAEENKPEAGRRRGGR